MKKLSISKLNKADSNRGATMITVILVMAVVSIVGFLIVSAAYSNFRRNYAEKNAMDNLYGAEKVLEEICVGLQEDVSECYGAAYTAVMKTYDKYETADEMQKTYEDNFFALMKNKLESDIGSGYYDINIIRDYLSDRYDESVVTIDAVSKKSGTNAVTGDSIYTYQSILEEADGALYIRNIYVTYIGDGHSDKITTDIRIDAPPVTFAKIANVPAITDYAVIAGSGIEVKGNYHAINGKTSVGLLEPTIEDEEATVSVDISGGANLTVNSEQFVAKGNVEISSSSAFTADADTTLWANGLATINEGAGANTISLLGKTYVKDDTTVNGKDNTVNLGGEYYGYSGSTTSASDSSAIIINGTGTTLNMSALNTMVLAGTSFVGTKGEAASTLKMDGESVNSSDVLMGDSVAVKTNQLIYMVPTECEGIGSNPMTYSEYSKLTGDWKRTALSTTISGLGKSIASYGNVDITPVFSNKQNGTVYLYLEFATAEAASKYFLDCYGNSEFGKKAQDYLSNYLKAFTISSSNQIHSAGNYLVQGTAGSAVYHAATAGIQDVDLAATFEELAIQLSFENIINEASLEEYVGKTIKDFASAEFMGFQGTATIPSTTAGEDSTEVEIVLVDNEGESAYTIGDTFTGVLIATGDVKIINGGANEVKGLIICKGKLTAEGSGTKEHPTKITYDEEVVSYALRIVNKEGIPAMSVFAGNEGISAGSVTGGTVIETEEVDIRNCITFENWKTE